MGRIVIEVSIGVKDMNIININSLNKLNELLNFSNDNSIFTLRDISESL